MKLYLYCDTYLNWILKYRHKTCMPSNIDLNEHAGVFDERVFKGLDWVLAEARKRKLKVMLTLVNYWSAYCGMPQYVKQVSPHILFFKHSWHLLFSFLSFLNDYILFTPTIRSTRLLQLPTIVIYNGFPFASAVLYNCSVHNMLRVNLILQVMSMSFGVYFEFDQESIITWQSEV